MTRNKDRAYNLAFLVFHGRSLASRFTSPVCTISITVAIEIKERLTLAFAACMLYKADDTDFKHLMKEGKECPPAGICRNCMANHEPECFDIPNPILYRSDKERSEITIFIDTVGQHLC